jgi:hypothetical protein
LSSLSSILPLKLFTVLDLLVKLESQFFNPFFYSLAFNLYVMLFLEKKKKIDRFSPMFLEVSHQDFWSLGSEDAM